MKILLVGHDAHPFGAQINVRHQGDTLKNQFGCEVAWLLRDGGSDGLRAVEAAARSRSPTTTPRDVRPAAKSSETTATSLRSPTPSGAGTLCLTSSGWDSRVVSLIHELPGMIEEYWLSGAASVNIAEGSDKVVLAADAVRDAIAEIEPAVRDKALVRPQGLYNEIERLGRAGPRPGRASSAFPPTPASS